MSVFEKLRGQNDGGGLMTLVHNNFKPVIIPTQNGSKISQNVLVVEGVIGKIRIRFINKRQLQLKIDAKILHYWTKKLIFV